MRIVRKCDIGEEDISKYKDYTIVSSMGTRILSNGLLRYHPNRCHTSNEIKERISKVLASMGTNYDGNSIHVVKAVDDQELPMYLIKIEVESQQDAIDINMEWRFKYDDCFCPNCISRYENSLEMWGYCYAK